MVPGPSRDTRIETSPLTVAVERGRAARLALYLGQMFPAQQTVPYAVCHFFAVWFWLQAKAGLPVVSVTWAALRGVVTVVLFLLLMRLYDELKDVHTDLALGRSGDPLYRDRVLVTGAVKVEDVVFLRWTVTAVLILVNVWPVAAWAHLAFWVLFGVAWLSSKWFFWPPMSRYLLVAFATHNPISLLLGGYIVALFVDTFGGDRIDGTAALLLAGLWLPMAAWETSRKVRAPGDETSYQTYSRVLGWKTAALLPGVFAIGSTTLLVLAARAAGLGAVFPLLIGAACALLVYRCVLFRLVPSRAHADLKPWAALYGTVANAGVVVAVLLEKPVIW